MCCEQIERQLGLMLDGELPPGQRAGVEAHLVGCRACRDEWQRLQTIAGALAQSDGGDLTPPEQLWPAITHRLDQTDAPDRSPEHRPSDGPPVGPRRPWFGPRVWQLAASLLMVAGLGVLAFYPFARKAEASTINFSVLLDALPLDAARAFQKFLLLYDAQPIAPAEAKRRAPDLQYDTPPTLPGGFRLQRVYLMRFAGKPGVAAVYDRGGEFLATIFHSPVKREDYGTHRDYPCVIGKHRGHSVSVGDWKLVHLTDPSTCHCVLSRLDESRDLPKIMSAVAPR